MRKLLMAALIVLPLAVAGCSKGPAEAALKAADEAIARVTPEVGKLAPAELKALTGAAADAKAKFDAGDYAGALAEARDLPAKAAGLARAAAAKKDEFTAKWKEFQGPVTGLLQTFKDRIGAVEGMKKRPKGFDPAQVASAKASLSELSALWKSATDAFSNGDFAAAIAKAADVRAQADALATFLESLPAPATK
jgi:hypothetical protein